MAQISVVQYSKTQSVNRLDSEYYKPFNLKAEKMIISSNYRPLKTLGKFIVGPFGSTVKVEDYVLKKDYKYIRGKDVKNGFISDIDNASISKEKYESLPQFHLKKGDILITVVGTLGNIAIYRDSFGPALFSCKSTAFRADSITPEFLLVFLLTKYGKSLLMRNERGAIQKGFNLPDLKEIPIPILNKEIRIKVKEFVLKSSNYEENSKNLYQQAEQLLLQELGLMDYKPNHDLTFEAGLSEVLNSRRFDADYYQPKYKEIEEKIKNYKNGNDLLKKAITVKDKNFYPKYDVDYDYIELANISANGHINGTLKEIGKNLPSRARRKVNEGDVIISSIEGSLESCALITKEYENSLCSTGFFVLKSDKINSETLLILFKSLIMQNLLKRGCKGTILTALSKYELEKIRIPLIKESIQKQIAEKIQESYKLRKESKELLEKAKRKVEEEIEKNR